MQKILCTGSLGLLISNFIRKFIYEKQPYEFVSIDNGQNEPLINSIYMNKNHQFYVSSITDEICINKIFEFEKPDIVIHGAAQTSVIDDNVIESFKTNITGTQVILNACKKYNVNKIIFPSTYQVYGHVNNDLLSFSENDLVNPTNSYAVSKASAEMLIKSFCRANGIDYNILRISNMFGSRQQKTMLIPKTIKSILENKDIVVIGNGFEQREWTHVNDVCDAIQLMLNHKNETFNVSSNYEFSTLEIVNEICNIMGKGHDLIKHVQTDNIYDKRYSVNSSKLRDIGWKPTVKFKESLKNTVSWYIANNWILK